MKLDQMEARAERVGGVRGQEVMESKMKVLS